MSAPNNLQRFWPIYFRFLLVLAGMLWFGAVVTRAAPHYVMPINGAAESPYETWEKAATNIQDALNVAVNGETVWVSNGTYYLTNQVSITNSVTLRSTNGYEVTVINGNYPAYTNVRGVYMVNTGAVLSGFTITNCFLDNTNMSGAGVYMVGGLLANCLVTGNIFSNNSTVSGFFTADSHSAGIYCNSTGIIDHCIIRGNRNTGKLSGAGKLTNGTSAIYFADGAYSIIKYCLISDNSSLGASSQAVFGDYYSVTMTQCVVSGNTSGAYGVSLRQWAIADSIISNNTALYGAISLGQNNRVRNCLIVNNSAVAVNLGDFGIYLENCTVANNGGVGIDGDAVESGKRQIENNILYYNGIGGTQNWNVNYTYTNCCTYPAAPGVNNITNPPMFLNTNSGNYRLSANSPCVNAGTNQAWMINAFDLDGKIRIRYGTVDIGAYERFNVGTIFKFH